MSEQTREREFRAQRLTGGERRSGGAAWGQIWFCCNSSEFQSLCVTESDYAGEAESQFSIVEAVYLPSYTPFLILSVLPSFLPFCLSFFHIHKPTLSQHTHTHLISILPVLFSNILFILFSLSPSSSVFYFSHFSPPLPCSKWLMFGQKSLKGDFQDSS